MRFINQQTKLGGHIVQGGAAKRDAYVGSNYPPMKTSTV